MLAPDATGSGASVLEMARTGADVTVVVIGAPAVGSVSLLSIPYVELVMTVPFASGLTVCTTSCTLPDVPAFRAPMFQVTIPAASVPPPVAETNEVFPGTVSVMTTPVRSEEHTSELQSQSNLVCRLLLEKKKKTTKTQARTTH